MLVEANGMLTNAKIRLSGNSYSIRPSKVAIPEYSQVLLSLIASTMILSVSKRVIKDVNKLRHA